MNLNNIKVGSQLYIGFGVLLVVLLILSVFSFSRIHKLDGEIDLLVSDRYEKTVLLSDTIDNLNIIATAMRDIALAGPGADITGDETRIQTAIQDNQRLFDKLSRIIKTPRGVAGLAELNNRAAVYYAEPAAVINLHKTGRTDEIKGLLATTIKTQQAAVFDTLNSLTAFQRGLMQDSATESHRIYQQSAFLLSTGAAAALLLGLAATLLITRNVVGQLGGEPGHARNTAHLISQGDLSTAVVLHRDDRASLMASMDTMRLGLATIVSNVRIGTDAISTAASEIAAGNLDLSSRTEQQAASLEETASSMEQLTQAVKQNSEHAQQASEMVVAASALAVEGGDVVRQVMVSMESINASSKRIESIIEVIDGIAFQTNILALNAAVEAARAGEHGRGFAVVASEVRALAQRSAVASKEIRELIAGSVNEAGQGNKLVLQAGQKMNDIVRSVQHVAGIMEDITRASSEQTVGIDEVNRAIAQMDQVTQQNAALVEEAAAAAQSLNHQAASLSDMVKVFRLPVAALT